MPLAAAPMLQQQKCLETLNEKKRQNIVAQCTKLRRDDVAAAKNVGDERKYAVNRLRTALNSTWLDFERTAWQHVAAQQQPTTTISTATSETEQVTSNLLNVRKNAKRIGITANCMLMAAPNAETHGASNFVDIATLAETQAALNEVLPTQLKASSAPSTPLIVENECSSSSEIKLLNNMLQQHAAQVVKTQPLTPSVAAVTSAAKCERIDAAKTKATTFKTTTAITTQSINISAMCEVVALPEPHDHQNTEKTIDFNSWRRRGRLRSAGSVGERDSGVVEFGGGITAAVCRALLWLATYLEKVASDRTAHADADYGKRDPLLYLLSVLLSLIVVNVNRVACLVNELNCEVNRKQIVNTDTTNGTTNNNNNTISNKLKPKLITEPIQASSGAEVERSGSEMVANEICYSEPDFGADFESTCVLMPAANLADTKRAVKAKNNSGLSSKTASIPNTTAEQSTKAPINFNTTTASPSEPQQIRGMCSRSTPSQQSTTSASTTNRKPFAISSQMQLLLFYAFILCTSILLPCGNNLVSAAKPKSATQLQQQKQLQQQQLLLQQQQQQQHEQHHQQGHQAHQPATGPNGVDIAGYPGLGIPVAAGGPGADLSPPTYQVVSSQTSNEEMEFVFPAEQSDEQLFDQEEQNLNVVELEDEPPNKAYDMHNNETIQTNETKAPLFPKDLFTKEQLENGAVICHIIGVIYMFVALAIVCDEFFVPSLDVIIEKLDITDDVAGATFMAAGGSAPELFTSVIGVFISFDDVGIGTIVGSAVFNILFVIGMCALFSKTILSLTWWPLFRDCSFYSISLMVLIYFFRDNFIYWWEALILFSIYIAYVAFMKWNVQVERFVKRLVTKNKVTRVRSTDQLMPAGNAANSSETSMATQPGGSVTSRAASETRSGPPGSSSGAGATGNSSGGTAGSTHTGAKFRHGLLQLMIHTIDPLHDGKVDEKATQLHAIASLKVLLDATKPQRGGATTSAANHVKINLKETTLADRPNGNIDTTLDSPSIQSQGGRRPSWIDQRVKIQTRKFSIKTNEIEDEPEPLSMAWPDTARKRLTYILVAPLLIPMWLTLPDTRTPRGKKYYPVTFIGSILWIAAFSYLMVWWANVAGDTARIPPEVMGLTFLAAGTSIPDLITSVIVARKGFGDMAVSSSVGSNIFDVTVGLPIPWLLYGIIYDAPVEVNSVGMVCSITILFMMLIFVVISIACFRWRMNRGLGFTMFLLYFVFVAVSLMFEYDTLQCPV